MPPLLGLTAHKDVLSYRSYEEGLVSNKKVRSVALKENQERGHAPFLTLRCSNLSVYPLLGDWPSLCVSA